MTWMGLFLSELIDISHGGNTSHEWHADPSEQDWHEKSEGRLYPQLQWQLSVLAHIFFTELPLRFIMFGAMKHSRDGYCVRNAMWAAVEAFDQYQHPAPWSQAGIDADRHICRRLRIRGNRDMRRDIWSLARSYCFATQEEDYWISRWNSEAAALRLEYLGIGEDSEEFNYLTQRAASYNIDDPRAANLHLDIPLPRSASQRGPSLEREYLGDRAEPPQGISLVEQDSAVLTEENDAQNTVSMVAHSLNTQLTIPMEVELSSVEPDCQPYETIHVSNEEEIWLLADQEFHVEDEQETSRPDEFVQLWLTAIEHFEPRADNGQSTVE